MGPALPDSHNVAPPHGSDLGAGRSGRLEGLLPAAHYLHRPLHVGGSYVADMGRDRPAMAEGMLDLPVAVTPEHLRNRHGCFGTGADGLRRQRIDILDIGWITTGEPLSDFGPRAPCSSISSTGIKVGRQSVCWHA